ncbi:dnaj chaperone-like protein [Angomonas deanei]|uniref:DnaJ domain containing protein, putative n=1 Tax=Angomonas deanei TaxID=59799 RepID=A0A7G2CJR0_9TRYP|nr:dnaj chaperone-like protein [Angomonas deanei]CAD2218843.1 DnaJ domain containing protein, putative [Angomonas deanei]|eukprot:EPY39025.1 dnaj chaperone-like protein [Angomonas deanei]
MGDYYDILEVPHDASDEDIKRSYRKLALKYHPDKAGAAGEAKFKEINAAYEVLSNPEKKKIYDRYGETGLNAMDGPMQSVVPLGAMNAVIPVVVLFLFLITAMQLIFLAFIAAYNNHKLQSWNYVKVFSPLFVSDVLVGVPALILFILLPCVLGGRFLFAMLSLLLVMLCSVLLTILIPIAKDRNDQRVREGRTDFLKWRVWLIPGYILSVFFVLFVCLAAFPSKEKKEAMKAYRLKRLANYQPISFIFKLLAALCVPVFFALIACRSDNTITINYFIVIGVPMYVATFFIILDYVITRILQCVLTVEDDDDDNNNNNENENNENNNNNNERPNRDENNQYSTDEGEAPPRGNNNNNENNNNNNNKNKKKGTTVCAVYNCCGLLFKIFGLLS